MFRSLAVVPAFLALARAEADVDLRSKPLTIAKPEPGVFGVQP